MKKATRPCQTIYINSFKTPIKDAAAIILMAFDEFSLFAFNPALKKYPMNDAEFISQIEELVNNISSEANGTIETIITNLPPETHSIINDLINNEVEIIYDVAKTESFTEPIMAKVFGKK